MRPLRARLILADDHPVVVAGLRAMLEGRHRVVAIAYTAAALLAALRTRQADALLLDIDLPDRNGLDLIPEIRRRWPRLRILTMTTSADAALCRAALSAGADGFATKDCGRMALLSAVRALLAGRTYVSRRLARASARIVTADTGYPGLTGLTARQWEVLQLLGGGRTTLEIAAALGISHQMVTLHRQNLRRKLGITSEAGLLQCAMLVNLQRHVRSSPARST